MIIWCCGMKNNKINPYVLNCKKKKEKKELNYAHLKACVNYVIF